MTMDWNDENRLYDCGFRLGAHNVFTKTIGDVSYDISHAGTEKYILTVSSETRDGVSETYTAAPMCEIWDLLEETGALEEFIGRANQVPQSKTCAIQTEREAALNLS